MPRIDVHPVPEGSLVLLVDVHPPGLGEDELADWTRYVGESICEVAGHQRFVMLVAHGAGARSEVWSLDDDLEARIRKLLDEFHDRDEKETSSGE